MTLTSILNSKHRTFITQNEQVILKSIVEDIVRNKSTTIKRPSYVAGNISGMAIFITYIFEISESLVVGSYSLASSVDLRR